MPRLVGINIPDNKQIGIALTYIYGIGPALSKKILAAARIDPIKRASQLKTEELNALKEVIEKNYRIEGELRRDIMMNIRRLHAIGAWRGVRHAKHLPVRGQRTRTNNRTVRGNVRKTVTSGRKPAASPT
ncbi:MAG TPA: 30S ribosomal protein S13 [Candidatus Paceibacterota bacterium]|nr:30S ribosomal protein S13 [Candidatus Paceibacterota bacterium]